MLIYGALVVMVAHLIFSEKKGDCIILYMLSIVCSVMYAILYLKFLDYSLSLEPSRFWRYCWLTYSFQMAYTYFFLRKTNRILCLIFFLIFTASMGVCIAHYTFNGMYVTGVYI